MSRFISRHGLRISIAYPWELGPTFPAPPLGYAYVTDDAGAFLTDDAGAYLLVEING
jgi:hypothetical protein